MADEKKTVGTAEKKPNKFVAFVKALPQKIATPFKNMWHELKKVTWPTRQAYLKNLAIVACFMVFMGVVIGLLDMGASKLVTALSSLNPNNVVEEVVTEDGTAQDNTAVETTEAPAAGN